MRTSLPGLLLAAALLASTAPADELNQLVNDLATRISNLDRATVELQEDMITNFTSRNFWSSEVRSKSEVAYLFDALGDFRVALSTLNTDVCQSRSLNQRTVSNASANFATAVRTIESACDRGTGQLSPVRTYRSLHDHIVRYKRGLDLNGFNNSCNAIVNYLLRPPPPPPPPAPPAPPAEPFALADVTTKFLRNDGQIQFAGPWVEANFKVIDIASTSSIYKVDLYIDNYFITSWATMQRGTNEVNFTDPRQPKTFNFNIQQPKAGRKAYIQVTHTNGRTYKLEIAENPYWQP